MIVKQVVEALVGRGLFGVIAGLLRIIILIS